MPTKILYCHTSVEIKTRRTSKKGKRSRGGSEGKITTTNLSVQSKGNSKLGARTGERTGDGAGERVPKTSKRGGASTRKNERCQD